MPKAAMPVEGRRASVAPVAFNVEQVGHSLNLHPETVRSFLRAGRIRGFRIGNRWRVAQQVLETLVRDGIPLATD